MGGDDTFMRITNRDIAEKIDKLIESNRCEHEKIMIHQKETNGKVKLNRWVATTALSILFILMGVMFNSHWG